MLQSLQLLFQKFHQSEEAFHSAADRCNTANDKAYMRGRAVSMGLASGSIEQVIRKLYTPHRRAHIRPAMVARRRAIHDAQFDRIKIATVNKYETAIKEAIENAFNPSPVPTVFGGAKCDKCGRVGGTMFQKNFRWLCYFCCYSESGAK